MQLHKDVRAGVGRRFNSLWRQVAETQRLIQMDRVGQFCIAGQLERVGPQALFA